MKHSDFVTLYAIGALLGVLVGWCAHDILAKRGPVEVTHKVQCAMEVDDDAR